VKVSFALDEVKNDNLSAEVYHIPLEDGNLLAESLETVENGNTVTAVSDGFSFYTVEFTYETKQYVMNGDTTVALSDILSYVGLTGEVSAVSVSDESLFSVSKESGEWIVTAHQAFHTDEWMKVTIEGVEYEIVVTDATTYTTSQTNLGWISGDVFVCNGSTYTFSNSGSENLVGVGGSGGLLASSTASISGNVLTLNGANYTLSGSNNAWRLENTNTEYDHGYYTKDWYFFETYVQLSVNPTYTAPTSKSMTYSGSAQSLVNAGSVSAGGSMVYALGTNSSTAPTSGWSTSVPTGTDVGTY